MSAITLGLRWMRRRPLTSIVTIVCLAIGIGATAAAAMLIDAIVLRPFAIDNARQLAVFWETRLDGAERKIEVSLPNFEDWERRATAFEQIAAYASSHWPGLGRVRGETFALAPRAVSRQFFSTLGVAPALGRSFTHADLDAAVLPPVVLSHALWASRFGSAPDVAGQTLFLDQNEHRIVGVMPRGFAFPDAPDVWISVERALETALAGQTTVARRGVGVLEVVGRLRPSRSLEDARSELTVIVQSLSRQYYPALEPPVAVALPFAHVLLGRLGPRLWIALMMAAAVLLFACANAIALRLAHGGERAVDLASRMFLGASKRVLIRQLTRESLPLIAAAALVGAACGVALVQFTAQTPIVLDSGIDVSGHWRVLGFALVAATAIAWLLVAWLPSLTIVQRLRPEKLLVSTRGVVGNRGGSRLLMPQAALAICVIGVAATAIEAFDRLARLDFGFAPANITAIDVSLPEWKYAKPPERHQLDLRMLAAARSLPGASGVAGVALRPFRFGDIADGILVGRVEDARDPSKALGANRMVVTPSYFDVMNIDIVRGRGFVDVDGGWEVDVAVLSDGLARALWPDRDPIGRGVSAITLNGSRSFTVIGVAEDVRSRVLERPAMEMYVPHSRGRNLLNTLLIRTDGGGVVTDASVRSALRQVDPEIAIERMQTMAAVVGSVTAPARVLATITGFLAVSALLLLALGIFGAAASALRASLAEVAIRQAVGATPAQAVRAPVRPLAIAIASGVLAGLFIAPFVLWSSELFGMPAPTTLVIPLFWSAMGVMAAAAVALWPVLRRVARTSPAELLRQT